MLSTVELNWGLPSLGRWDCNANVLALVANKTGYTNAVVNTTNLYFNSSYPGPLSDTKYIPVWPVPTNGKCAAGSILSSVVSTWGSAGGTRNYTNVFPVADSSSSTSPSSTGSSTGEQHREQYRKHHISHNILEAFCSKLEHEFQLGCLAWVCRHCICLDHVISQQSSEMLIKIIIYPMFASFRALYWYINC